LSTVFGIAPQVYERRKLYRRFGGGSLPLGKELQLAGEYPYSDSLDEKLEGVEAPQMDEVEVEKPLSQPQPDEIVGPRIGPLTAKESFEAGIIAIKKRRGTGYLSEEARKTGT